MIATAAAQTTLRRTLAFETGLAVVAAKQNGFPMTPMTLAVTIAQRAGPAFILPKFPNPFATSRGPLAIAFAAQCIT